MTSPLELLPALRDLDRESLAQLVQARAVPSRGITGLIDLAEWLVDPEQLAEALGRLPWRDVVAMQDREADAITQARALLLTNHDGELLPEVARLLEELRAADGGPAHAGDPENDAVQRQLDASAAEQSFTALQLAAELLHRVDTGQIASRNDRRGVRMAGVDVRRLAASLEARHESISALSSLVIRAEVMAERGDSLALTQAGRDWLLASMPERWHTLATSWLTSVTAHERALLLTGTPSDAQLESAHALGVIAEHPDSGTALSSIGALVLDGDVDAARDLLTELFPHAVDQVYFQADGAVIAPGPLVPQIDEQLRARAEIEQSGIATRFRVTRQSLTRALAAGDSPDALREAFDAISIGGIPQPIDYLIHDVAEHYGEIRVRPHDDPFARGCRVLADDPKLLDALEVDRSLAALGLRRHGQHELSARVHPEGVYHSLLDAKIPVAAEHVDGSPWRIDLPRTAVAAAPTLSPSQERLVDALLDDVEREEARDGEEAWLRRQLDRARRDKRVVRVDVNMGRDIRSLELIPTSVTGPRFRGRDLEADVERTIPFSALTGVHDTDD